MKVALGSIFQNATRYIDRYAAQIYSLIAMAPEHEFDLLLVEGDSTDNEASFNKLEGIFPGCTTKRNHGGKVFGSVDDPQRWTQVSYAVEGVLERLKPEHDALLYVESDLIVEAPTLIKMLDWLSKVDCVAPMIIMGTSFYDTWAYRKDGTNFSGMVPFHPTLAKPNGNGLCSLDSGGGVFAVKGEIARKCHCTPEHLALVGFYNDMRSKGHSVWLDPKLTVWHPRVG